MGHTDGGAFLRLLFNLELDLPHPVHDFLKLVILSNHRVTAAPKVHLPRLSGILVMETRFSHLGGVLHTDAGNVDLTFELLDYLPFEAQQVQVLDLLLGRGRSEAVLRTAL